MFSRFYCSLSKIFWVLWCILSFVFMWESRIRCYCCRRLAVRVLGWNPEGRANCKRPQSSGTWGSIIAMPGVLNFLVLALACFGAASSTAIPAITDDTTCTIAEDGCLAGVAEVFVGFGRIWAGVRGRMGLDGLCKCVYVMNCDDMCMIVYVNLRILQIPPEYSWMRSGRSRT